MPTWLLPGVILLSFIP